jgi:glycosyltransferase involved in cell wall biosynthesis
VTTSPTISVIIPVYNGSRFIREALTSVCTQTCPPAEIVVADDVSTDDTREVVADFAKTSPVPVQLFSMERNTGGPYGPASRAFGRTRGDYVCILDADDLFAPDAFAHYMRMFAADPTANVGLATSDFLTFEDGTGRITIPSFFQRRAELLKDVLERDTGDGVLLQHDEALRLISHAFVIPFKGMVARKTWATLGGPNLRYRHACDCDFIWRLLTSTDYSVRMSKRQLMRVRCWPGSMSSNRGLESRELVALFRTMVKTAREPEFKWRIRGRLESELYDLAYVSYKRRDFASLVPAAIGLAAARVRRALTPAPAR